MCRTEELNKLYDLTRECLKTKPGYICLDAAIETLMGFAEEKICIVGREVNNR